VGCSRRGTTMSEARDKRLGVGRIDSWRLVPVCTAKVML
jgi:hypothetical protein